MRTERRLAGLSERLTAARRELEIAREQLAYLDEVVDEAKVRMLVSGTPLSEREHRDARDDFERLKRHHDEVLDEVTELSREQDALLDKLLEESLGR